MVESLCVCIGKLFGFKEEFLRAAFVVFNVWHHVGTLVAGVTFVLHA